MTRQKLNRIDLHSHLLPGIDDGCQSVTESLDCIRQLKERGFTGTVCTPHMGEYPFPENTPVRIERLVRLLRKELAAAGLSYRIWSGGELRLSAGVIAWMEQHGAPTLGESNHVLVDWWDHDWPTYLDEALRWLLARGYQPVLAHPERMPLPPAVWRRTLARLAAEGVLLQGNFNSLSGGEGDTPLERAMHLLDQGAYHVLALDMHGPDTLPGRFAGIHAAQRQAGSAGLTELLEARPRQIAELAVSKVG